MNIHFCIEASFERGMGHLYRALRLSRALQTARKDVQVSFSVNLEPSALRLLKESGYDAHPISFSDEGWEDILLRTARWNVWINDRLDTSLEHSRKIKNHGAKLVTFDDRGAGAALADLHVAPLIFHEPLQGKKVISGPTALLVEPNFRNFVRRRTSLDRVLVAMGGSDNHGLTSLVLQRLTDLPLSIDVLLGPLNRQEAEVRRIAPRSTVHRAVPDIGALFEKADLMISAGGMMPFEALATGLPVLACAAETFEVPVAREIQTLGGGFYCGDREQISSFDFKSAFEKISVQISELSRRASEIVDFHAGERLAEEILHA
jgi:spore coat polysaccharide biosynthesis predicted glycosyltransferase SpsG